MSEDKEKNTSAIQKYNSELAEDSPEEEEIKPRRPFSNLRQQPEDNNEPPGLRGQLIKITAENIRMKNEGGIRDQQLEARDEALDNVEMYGIKHTQKVAKLHGLIMQNDLEGALTRKILFKVGNYLLMAAGIIIALLSGTNPSVQAAVNNFTKSPIEILGLAAFISLDFYIWIRYFRGK